jgi:hypothetical protein
MCKTRNNSVHSAPSTASTVNDVPRKPRSIPKTISKTSKTSKSCRSNYTRRPGCHDKKSINATIAELTAKDRYTAAILLDTSRLLTTRMLDRECPGLRKILVAQMDPDQYRKTLRNVTDGKRKGSKLSVVVQNQTIQGALVGEMHTITRTPTVVWLDVEGTWDGEKTGPSVHSTVKQLVQAFAEGSADKMLLCFTVSTRCCTRAMHLGDNRTIISRDIDTVMARHPGIHKILRAEKSYSPSMLFVAMDLRRGDAGWHKGDCVSVLWPASTEWAAGFYTGTVVAVHGSKVRVQYGDSGWEEHDASTLNCA